MKRTIILLLAASLLAVPALAQQIGPGPGVRPMRPDGAQMERQRADDMALVLGLSAAQRPLLDAFLRHPQPPAPPMPDAAPPSFGQELDRMEQGVTRHMAEERQHMQAARALYSALDARQKTVFDALMRLSHGGPHGGFRGAHGPHDMGPEAHDGPPPPPAQ